MKRITSWVCCAVALLFTTAAWAQQPAGTKVDSGDTAWVLVSSALVMLMTPGLAFFYCGMVRRKNVLGTIMHSYILLGLITVQWVLWGYTLAFGPDIGGVIGNLSWLGLHGVGAAPNPDYAATIPHEAFMAFQMMFAIITPALIFGAVAERMKFSAMVVFALLWATLVYDPICHWVWNVNGWLHKLGALDFLEKPLSTDKLLLTVDNVLKLTVLGAGLLWFGWFGFNAGSALAANGLAATAFVNTHVASASAALSWTVLEWRLRGKPSLLGAVSGCVAGLVAVTPAAGFVSVLGALAIGLIGGAACYCGVTVKNRFRFDDTLDAFGIHGVGGTVGALLTGVFCTVAVNEAGANGLFFGNPMQLVRQAAAVGATIAYAVVVTWILLKAVDLFVGLRVTAEEEEQGLDWTQHGETGYNL